jgi:hypothetical protein
MPTAFAGKVYSLCAALGLAAVHTVYVRPYCCSSEGGVHSGAKSTKAV